MLDRQFACSLHLDNSYARDWGIGGLGDWLGWNCHIGGYLCLDLWILLSYLADWNWNAGLHITYQVDMV